MKLLEHAKLNHVGVLQVGLLALQKKKKEKELLESCSQGSCTNCDSHRSAAVDPRY